MAEVFISPDENHGIQRPALCHPTADQLGVFRDDPQPVGFVELQELGCFAGCDAVSALFVDHVNSMCPVSKSVEFIALSFTAYVRTNEYFKL